MRCEKCLHYEVCVKLGKPSLYGINQKIGCSAYKDNTKWVENKFDECDYKDCHYRTEPITNGDRIRSMGDEELAEFIKNIKARAVLCKAVKNNDAFEELCSSEWIKQPAEEK